MPSFNIFLQLEADQMDCDEDHTGHDGERPCQVVTIDHTFDSYEDALPVFLTAVRAIKNMSHLLVDDLIGADANG